MTFSKRAATVRVHLVALAAALFLSACGGSSGGAPAVETPAPTTGTFGLFVTDKPSEIFMAINLDITGAVLIGGDDSQQVLFDVAHGADPRRINLLDLTNFNEPIVFGEVAVGTYSKLRLYIDRLELVPNDPNADPILIDRLPANGKIDLLDQDGFEILPGETLLAEVDIDANKSIKVTGAGNSGKYQFRPVVKVQFSYDGEQDKLARVEGVVSDPLDPAGSFSLCATEAAENCVDVMTGLQTSFFDDSGLPTDFTGVALASPVVVFGRYQVDPDIFLEAIVVEIGGNSEQVKGNVVSNPVGDAFLLFAEDGSNLTVDLQAGTRYFDASGEIGSDAIVLGADVEVEGVIPEAEPGVIRAALVFVEAEDDEQISGRISSEVSGRTFDLLPADSSTLISVTVLESADILIVDEAAGTVTIGDISSLANGQTVELFGTTPTDGMFDANEVIVIVTP